MGRERKAKSVIYIDTNLMIRLLTNDVPELAEKARLEIDKATTEKIFVSDVVFSELFFVLERHKEYLMKRSELVTSIYGLLASGQLICSPEAENALSLAAENSKLDFADCLLAVYSGFDERKLFSFDKDLLKVLR